MTHIDINEASTHFLELIEQVIKGEEIIIDKNGQPVARLSSLGVANRPRQFGSAKGLVHVANDFDEPLPDFADYS
jgi:prevent-host-death family protein